MQQRSASGRRRAGSPAGRSSWGRTDTTRTNVRRHKVAVGGFWIDETTVTNAEYAAFVAATGYVTVAERQLVGSQLSSARLCFGIE
jgi:formylglycine-generating enzyme required for sulfatase activity